MITLLHQKRLQSLLYRVNYHRDSQLELDVLFFFFRLTNMTFISVENFSYYQYLV